MSVVLVRVVSRGVWMILVCGAAEKGGGTCTRSSSFPFSQQQFLCSRSHQPVQETDLAPQRVFFNIQLNEFPD